MGKFRHCLPELSARDTIMVGYYSCTFLFHCFFAIFHSFSVKERLCFEILAFPGYLHVYIVSIVCLSVHTQKFPSGCCPRH